jgi:GT2 family glycosyltransferase/glycosyltransferase involved in cell wall biosynthesis
MTLMWPLNLPARMFLKLPGATSVAWAVFDADWYRATYATDTAALGGAPPDAVLAFYFETGQALGHSPNMLFDEAWHRRAYPGMAAVVADGRFPSTFDAYCRGGALDRSPHWLFDEAAYRGAYPDLTDPALAARGLVNGYDHYLWRGNAEHRIGHALFDPAVYVAHLPAEEADAAAADGPFWHFLRRLHRGAPEVPTSAGFDPVWYRARYPAVAEAIDRGTWRSALEHYLCNDTPTRFDPHATFSEADYLAHTPDVAAAVENRQFRNGYAHFLRHGDAARRAPSGSAGLGRNGGQAAADARDAVSRVHEGTIGRPPGLEPAAGGQEGGGAGLARGVMRARARTLSVLHARARLRFETTGAPAVSVLMVLRDGFDLTMMALGSLRSNYPGAIELILIDSGSTDETRHIERYVRGATYLRFDEDIGYLRGGNVALTFATADAVLYLDTGIEPAPGAVAAALRRLTSDPLVGAVSGMVINTENAVVDAGGIVLKDGFTHGYMRTASPLAAEVNFARDVDYGSGVFLAARRTVISGLGGFDEAFAADHYGDVDLCVRLGGAGYRVVYDPGVVVTQLDDGGGARRRAAAAEVDHARQAFVRKHPDFVVRRGAGGEREYVFARMADVTQTRVLFLDDTVPLRGIGSGFVRSNDLVTVMASMGYGVTVYPLNGCDCDPAVVYADMPDTVEVMRTHSVGQLRSFLQMRQGYYDVIWIARTHNFGAVWSRLQEAVAGSAARPRIVLDTEAIAALRDAEQAALAGQTFDVDAAVRQELHNAALADRIVAVTAAEAATLRAVGLADVSVVGHMRSLSPTPRPFAQRVGMLFVGAIHRMDSPNYDGLCWFVDEVLPLIEQDLGWQTRLTVAGYTGADVNLDRFRDHPRVTLRGAVADLVPLYDSHRIFVAPTRFAAGAPYKIHEAASFGLPVVATALLGQQLGWTDERTLLTASASDPAGFARHTVALQRDEALWQRLRDAALERIGMENRLENYATAIASVLGPPRTAR